MATTNTIQVREILEDARKTLSATAADSAFIEESIKNLLEFCSITGYITQTYDINWRTLTELFVSFVATDDIAHIQHEWLEFDYLGGSQDNHDKAYERAMRGI